MEEVCERTTRMRAWNRVRENQGSPGVDGLTIDATLASLRVHWPIIKAQLLHGSYTPHPVKRVLIPKPGGGVRKRGVPWVVDRLLQQVLWQVLQPRWDPTFAEHSDGFRPGRSAHQAVAQAQQYMAEGHPWVVHIWDVAAPTTRACGPWHHRRWPDANSGCETAHDGPVA